LGKFFPLDTTLHFPDQSGVHPFEGAPALGRKGQLPVLLVAVVLLGALPLGLPLGVGQLGLNLELADLEALRLQLGTQLGKLFSQGLRSLLVAGPQHGLDLLALDLQDHADLAQFLGVQPDDELFHALAEVAEGAGLDLPVDFRGARSDRGFPSLRNGGLGTLP